MKRSVYLVILSIVLSILAPSCGGKSDNKSPERELDVLNRVMRRSEDYQRLKRRDIDSLKHAMTATPESNFSRRSELALRIADSFRLYNADSAMFYSEMAYRMVEKQGSYEQKLNALLVHNNALSTAGVFTVAQQNLNTIGHWHIPANMKVKYWESMRLLYGYMRDFYAQQTDMYAIADRFCEQYDDSLMHALPENDLYARFLKGERLMNAGRYADALARMTQLLKTIPEESPYYGKTAYLMARIYLSQGDQTQYVANLAKSATADIKGCIREGQALPALADWMASNNQLPRAYDYINYALEDATSGNARMRTYHIARFLPKIDKAYRENLSAYHNSLLAFVFLGIIVIIVFVILTIRLRRQNRRARQNEEKLAQTSRMQESYFANFVALSSNYANRLESLTKLVGRKLASGQADELLKLINSGKLTDSQAEDFHSIFDRAFLDIYPQFTDKINTLLREEERISLRNPGQLTPELRIYALVRLGIDESTRIAQILNYSVSTVYAYRNRMRNKAINRDTFDLDVRG